MSLALRLALILVFLLAAALLLLLATASSSSSVFDQFYPWLIAANTVLAVTMAGLTAWVVARAVRRYRRRVFGARLMVRLALAFALIGAVPVIMVSLVSAQFLARTIDTWFSQGVNVALESGVSLGRASLDAIQNDVMSKTRRLALALEGAPATQMIGQIEKAIDGKEGVDVLVLSGSGAVLASRSAQLSTLVPELPPSEVLNRARAARQTISVEPRPGATDHALQVRAIAMTTRLMGSAEETRFIQWVEQIPGGLASNLEALNDGVRDYQQLALGKQGLRKIYGVTLLLALLLAFFGAVLSAVLLSGWLAGPLRQLERATKAVALGDYRPLRVDLKSNDELNMLVNSFNQMTSQLTEARDIAEKSRTTLEQSNLFLTEVLAHLSAGVVVFDARWRITQFNAGAERLLAQKLESEKEISIESLKALSDCARQLREGLAQEAEVQFQHETLRPDGAHATFLVSGSRLPGAVAQYVLVFDDIGELLSAQRSKASADMARRLAHEIKNPLTPIQLSAERLDRRLSERLAGEDAELLHRSTQTIVEQVSALKAMVDEFRNYARLPSANPEAVEMGTLLNEMLLLYASDKRVRFQAPAGPHLVYADRAQLIQVVHNLIQNAQDAVGEKPDGEIVLALTEIANPGQVPSVRLSVSDNGAGLSPQAQARIFEPYYTSKTKGSGLGLAIVKKIVEENQGKVSLVNRISADSGQILGAVASVEFAKLENASQNQRMTQKGVQA